MIISSHESVVWAFKVVTTMSGKYLSYAVSIQKKTMNKIEEKNLSIIVAWYFVLIGHHHIA